MNDELQEIRLGRNRKLKQVPHDITARDTKYKIKLWTPR